MILHCNYEEITALAAGGRSLLAGESEAPAYVLAPEESLVRVEALLPLLVGDISLGTLAEVRAVSVAVDAIVGHLRVEMETMVLATHAADEDAVAAYFDFAHALGVGHRLHEMAVEMKALVELVTGEPVDEHTAQTFRFPD